jgi:hypothetical protein
LADVPGQEAIAAHELVDCFVSGQWKTVFSKVASYPGLTKCRPVSVRGIENIFFLVDSP